MRLLLLRQRKPTRIIERRNEMTAGLRKERRGKKTMRFVGAGRRGAAIQRRTAAAPGGSWRQRRRKGRSSRRDRRSENKRRGRRDRSRTRNTRGCGRRWRRSSSAGHHRHGGLGQARVDGQPFCCRRIFGVSNNGRSRIGRNRTLVHVADNGRRKTRRPRDL